MTNLDPQVKQYIDQRVQEALQEERKAAGAVAGVPPRRNRMAIVASKGSMDMAYMPLILASTAGAMDMECAIFFTFYGLQIIHTMNEQKLQVPPLANPAMPMPGAEHDRGAPRDDSDGDDDDEELDGKGESSGHPELLELCKEGGVKLIACQMSMDVMGIHKEELVDGCEFAGAGTFLGYAAEAAITLFV